MALVLLALVVTSLSFVTGALQARTLPSAWQLSAYDTKGIRRFALTLSAQERPDIALFDARGRRFVPGLPGR
jgi:hypothetical protein